MTPQEANTFRNLIFEYMSLVDYADRFAGRIEDDNDQRLISLVVRHHKAQLKALRIWFKDKYPEYARPASSEGE